MSNPFKGAENFKIENDKKEKEKKKQQLNEMSEERSLQGMLVGDDTYENAIEELANTNRPLIQYDKDSHLDTTPIDFEKSKVSSPQKNIEQKMVVEREQSQEWIL